MTRRQACRECSLCLSLSLCVCVCDGGREGVGGKGQKRRRCVVRRAACVAWLQELQDGAGLTAPMYVGVCGCMCVSVCECVSVSVRVGHSLGGPALLTGRIPLPKALGLPCLSCNSNGNARPVIAIHPPLRSRLDRVVTPMPSFDRHLANAAILVSLGRLLLLLPLPLPLLHNTHAHAAAAPPPPLYPSPLQGQRTHTSCMMRRSEHTGERPVGQRGRRIRERQKVKATNYSPPWIPGQSP